MHLTGWSKEFSARISVPLGEKSSRAKLNFLQGIHEMTFSTLGIRLFRMSIIRWPIFIALLLNTNSAKRSIFSCASETAALGTSKNASSRTSFLYEATLAGTDTPKLPKTLVWYHHEPTWQTVARGRIDFGLSDFSLNVTYEDDFGINAGLKAAVVTAGLELGGKFEDHQSTIWRLEGTFRRPSNHS